MFVIFGEREARKRLGYVAEYCPLCRDIHIATITEIRKVTHLYYIPLGKGKVHLVERRCESCDDVAAVERERYIGFEQRGGATVAELIERTNPAVEQEMIELLEIEERVAAGEATADERFTLLCQPFLAIEPSMQKRTASVHFDAKSWFWLFMTFAAPWSLILLGMKLRGSLAGEVYLWSGILFALVSGVVFLWMLATDAKRFVQRRHGKFLVESLVYLRPSTAEIHQIRLALQHQKTVVIRKLSTGWLYDQLIAAGMEPAAPPMVEEEKPPVKGEIQAVPLEPLPRFSS